MNEVPELRDGQEMVSVRADRRFAKVTKRQHKKGYDKYGVHLTSFNGRDPAEDAFEELVDAVQYVEQLAMERDVMAYFLYWVHENYHHVYDMLCPADAIHESIMKHGERVHLEPPTEK